MRSGITLIESTVQASIAAGDIPGAVAGIVASAIVGTGAKSSW